MTDEQKKKRTNYYKQWRLKNPTLYRSYRLYSRYGITLDEYNQALLRQQGKCAICEKETELEVDHSHTTGKFRALLCRSCNLKLGRLEKTGFLLRAAKYVLAGGK